MAWELSFFYFFLVVFIVRRSSCSSFSSYHDIARLLLAPSQSWQIYVYNLFEIRLRKAKERVGAEQGASSIHNEWWRSERKEENFFRLFVSVSLSFPLFWGSLFIQDERGRRMSNFPQEFYSFKHFSFVLFYIRESLNCSIRVLIRKLTISLYRSSRDNWLRVNFTLLRTWFWILRVSRCDIFFDFVTKITLRSSNTSRDEFEIQIFFIQWISMTWNSRHF